VAPIGSAHVGTLLKHHIPLKTDRWDVVIPGFTEIDLVPHCGSLGDGEFVPASQVAFRLPACRSDGYMWAIRFRMATITRKLTAKGCAEEGPCQGDIAPSQAARVIA